MCLSVQTVLWTVLLVSIIHVLEEYFAGFVKVVNEISPIKGITTGQFIFINLLMFLLEILAIIVNTGNVLFTLSVGALIFINALIHLGGSIKFKRYMPGLISAIAGYIPLSIFMILLYQNAGLIVSPIEILFALILGLCWMIIPFCYQCVRILYENRKNRAKD